MRKIPATMATQHPDNANGPFWEREDGFVSVQEELEECVVCLRDLGVEEFMWDWEGKYADESVIDKLFSSHYDYFSKHLLGRDTFLTFRIPNVERERGYSLIRALMVILTSEDFAHDLKFKSRPLFEVILPMTESAKQLMYIQTSFQKLAQFKNSVFRHRKDKNRDYVELIPLIEGVNDQITIRELLADYVRLHRKHFGRKPAYIRPFLARSDPALISGFIPNVLANKIALSKLYEFAEDEGVPVYPIIGAGSLIFRGGLSPSRVKKFVDEYRGVRTVTIQSAFRYDYPLRSVKNALRYLEKALPKRSAQRISSEEEKILAGMIRRFSNVYQSTIHGIVPDLAPIFAAVPKRRERRQHIGLLAYTREVGKSSLPRAISFAAGLYSLGIPPEFIGLGRALSALTEKEAALLKKHYRYLKEDVVEAGYYLNRYNIERLARTNPRWNLILKDVALAEEFFGVHVRPRNKSQLLHYNLASQLFLQKDDPKEVQKLITETGKLRGSLG